MEKVRRKISRHYIDNMSIKNSFVFYALISLVIGIVIGVISITLVDDYRINLNYKYETFTFIISSDLSLICTEMTAPFLRSSFR